MTGQPSSLNSLLTKCASCFATRRGQLVTSDDTEPSDTSRALAPQRPPRSILRTSSTASEGGVSKKTVTFSDLSALPSKESGQVGSIDKKKKVERASKEYQSSLCRLTYYYDKVQAIADAANHACEDDCDLNKMLSAANAAGTKAFGSSFDITPDLLSDLLGSQWTLYLNALEEVVQSQVDLATGSRKNSNLHKTTVAAVRGGVGSLKHPKISEDSGTGTVSAANESNQLSEGKASLAALFAATKTGSRKLTDEDREILHDVRALQVIASPSMLEKCSEKLNTICPPFWLERRTTSPGLLPDDASSTDADSPDDDLDAALDEARRNAFEQSSQGSVNHGQQQRPEDSTHLSPKAIEALRTLQSTGYRLESFLRDLQYYKVHLSSAGQVGDPALVTLPSEN